MSDLATGTATLIKSVNQPEGLTAGATGSAQTTKNGDLFVSWGGLSYFSEFSPSGKLLFNAKYPRTSTKAAGIGFAAAGIPVAHIRVFGTRHGQTRRVLGVVGSSGQSLGRRA